MSSPATASLAVARPARLRAVPAGTVLPGTVLGGSVLSGAVLSGTEIIGSWRPKSAGKAFTLRLELWTSVSKAARTRLEVEAERLAAHRGQNLEAIVEE